MIDTERKEKPHDLYIQLDMSRKYRQVFMMCC
jgi:hypothetical protein